MNKLQKRVLKAEWRPGCYILVSASCRDSDYGYQCEPHMSFFYVNGNNAAEWEPRHGPIQSWHRCNADAEGAEEHYFFDYTDSPPGSWSQLAVDRHELPQAFVRGDYEHIFSVLEMWTE
jgi:hypothetical protein